MTKITRPVIRETDAPYNRERNFVIEATPRFLEIWPKGTKQRMRVPYDAIYDLGRKIHARGLK